MESEADVAYLDAELGRREYDSHAGGGVGPYTREEAKEGGSCGSGGGRETNAALLFGLLDLFRDIISHRNPPRWHHITWRLAPATSTTGLMVQS